AGSPGWQGSCHNGCCQRHRPRDGPPLRRGGREGVRGGPERPSGRGGGGGPGRPLRPRRRDGPGRRAADVPGGVGALRGRG
ncbi:MAG: 3-oxoacyl-[acyl-carrier protein] reductase, partial [uncultured Rubrobacteraceae bacterium]